MAGQSKHTQETLNSEEEKVKIIESTFEAMRQSKKLAWQQALITDKKIGVIAIFSSGKCIANSSNDLLHVKHDRHTTLILTFTPPIIGKTARLYLKKSHDTRGILLKNFYLESEILDVVTVGDFTAMSQCFQVKEPSNTEFRWIIEVDIEHGQVGYLESNPFKFYLKDHDASNCLPEYVIKKKNKPNKPKKEKKSMQLLEATLEGKILVEIASLSDNSNTEVLEQATDKMLIGWLLEALQMKDQLIATQQNAIRSLEEENYLKELRIQELQHKPTFKTPRVEANLTFSFLEENEPTNKRQCNSKKRYFFAP